MKRINELKATYGSEGISDLVDFVRIAPIELPEGEYHFEKQGTTVHIYGTNTGIDQYQLGQLEAEMSLKGAKRTNTGHEIDLTIGEIEKIVLHSAPFAGSTPASRKHRQKKSSNSGESRGSSESSRCRESRQGYKPRGESRGGESR